MVCHLESGAEWSTLSGNARESSSVPLRLRSYHGNLQVTGTLQLTCKHVAHMRATHLHVCHTHVCKFKPYAHTHTCMHTSQWLSGRMPDSRSREHRHKSLKAAQTRGSDLTSGLTMLWAKDVALVCSVTSGSISPH